MDYLHNLTCVIDDEKCKLNGYVNAEFKSDKIVNAWDKALYYFGVENKNYEFIWFLEDDVFFHEENTLIQIDNQYSREDLLSNLYFIFICSTKLSKNPPEPPNGSIHKGIVLLSNSGFISSIQKVVICLSEK